jgi:hypothetical protein
MNEKRIEAVLAVSGPERVKHFAQVVADREEAWGLYDGGWASSATDDGGTAFPLWPAPGYAQLCAAQEWSTYSPRAIALDDLMEALIPMLRAQSASVAVFQTPEGRGVTVAPGECRRYWRANWSDIDTSRMSALDPWGH